MIYYIWFKWLHRRDVQLGRPSTQDSQGDFDREGLWTRWVTKCFFYSLLYVYARCLLQSPEAEGMAWSLRFSFQRSTCAVLFLRARSLHLRTLGIQHRGFCVKLTSSTDGRDVLPLLTWVVMGFHDIPFDSDEVSRVRPEAPVCLRWNGSPRREVTKVRCRFRPKMLVTTTTTTTTTTTAATTTTPHTTTTTITTTTTTATTAAATANTIHHHRLPLLLVRGYAQEMPFRTTRTWIR